MLIVIVLRLHVVKLEVFDDVGVAGEVFVVMVTNYNIGRLKHVPSIVDSPPQV